MFELSLDGQIKVLTPGKLILVGRGANCDVVLNDPSASRVHCRFLSRDGRVFLTDAGSRWGTFVNGKQVTECELRPGDEILIGETILQLLVSGESHGTTLAQPGDLVRPDGLTIQRPPVPVDLQPVPHRLIADESPFEVPLITPLDWLGSSISGWRLEQIVAHTRQGVVFRAARGRSLAAVKLYHPDQFQDATHRQRFSRAVETACGIQHPHLVELIDGGFLDGFPYTVSEYFESDSAVGLIRRIGIAGMLDWRSTLQIAIGLASALEYLEAHRVLHRSITPQHILIRPGDWHVKLNGLLLAKTLNDGQPALTQADEIIGELPYLSPEQLGNGQPVDHLSDIYQCGAALYSLLTGRPPFSAGHPAQLIQQVLNDTPTPPTRYHFAIPSAFEGAVLKMLAKRPQDRFQSAVELIRELERINRYTQ